MNRFGRSPRPALSGIRKALGWVLFGLYVLVFPWLMGLIQRAFHGALPVAEANVVYYLVCAALVCALFWDFLSRSFHHLVDFLPENLLALAAALVGGAAGQLAVRFLPLPVEDPNDVSYAQQYLLSPRATVLILVVLMPLVEEVFFRGLVFETLRPLGLPAAWVVSAAGFAVYCVWQFAWTTGDPRYLLLAVRYLPAGVALTWCRERGGSVWTPAAAHMGLNALTLWYVQGVPLPAVS